jgi:hypothetical protein
LKDEEAMDWCKRISTLSLDKGNKLKECHGDLPKERGLFFGYGRRKERGGGSVRNFVNFYVCKNQAWRECVQESSIERVCVRIKHEKNLCSKYLLQSLWMLVQLIVSPPLDLRQN